MIQGELRLLLQLLDGEVHRIAPGSVEDAVGVMHQAEELVDIVEEQL